MKETSDNKARAAKPQAAESCVYQKIYTTGKAGTKEAYHGK
jgi:hypothetical protein